MIKEDAEDQIILGDIKIGEIFFGLLLIIFCGGFLWLSIPTIIRDYNNLGILALGVLIFIMLIFGIGFLTRVTFFLIKCKIVIDKKNQKSNY